MTICEDDLIARAMHGDQEAFRQLWELHHAMAMATALRLCHHRALAEEITQGAFLLFPIAILLYVPWLMHIQGRKLAFRADTLMVQH